MAKLMAFDFAFSPSAWYRPENRTRGLLVASALIVAIAATDDYVIAPFGFGNLYLFPIIMAAGFLVPWQILLMSLACTVLRESFNYSNDKAWADVLPRMFLSFSGFAGTGLFIREVVVNRQRIIDNLVRFQEQVLLRKDAEEQLQILVESSPAAIIIVDSAGKVVEANGAAARLLVPDSRNLLGQAISEFFPVLGAVPRGEQPPQPFRTKIETRGRRGNGEVFPAHIWLSTYNTHSGARMAAIALDASEDLREREEEGLHRLLSQSHIVAGAVWHEVRNLCAAISVVHANLQRDGRLDASADFQALGSLVGGLKNLASAELRPLSDVVSEEVDLREVLEDLRIVVGGQFAEADSELRIDVEEEVGPVIAERYGLLQVFLNLAQNSLRAMRNMPVRVLTIRAIVQQDRVVVRFRDTGSGLANAETLFQPFQQEAEVTGLGLYVSRAMMRDFLGELVYEPQEGGCCFAIRLNPARVAVEALEGS